MSRTSFENGPGIHYFCMLTGFHFSMLPFTNFHVNITKLCEFISIYVAGVFCKVMKCTLMTYAHNIRV